MTQVSDQEMLAAIRDAVELVIAELGIDYIRTMPMFPSAPVNQMILGEAA